MKLKLTLFALLFLSTNLSADTHYVSLSDKGYIPTDPSDNIGFEHDLPKTFYKINVRLD